MKELDVYLFDSLAGSLRQNEAGKLEFSYKSEYLDQLNPVPISHSLPLRSETFSEVECIGFFGGILPEESQREAVARILGMSEKNTFGLLREIGGETIGGLTLIPHGEPFNQEGDYRKLNMQEWETVVNSIPSRPLLAGEEGIRLSLAGAQPKLSVRFLNGEYSIPIGSAPSTHLVKPQNRNVTNLVENEFYCMQLASHVGLNVATVSIERAGKSSYLLVERYDRKIDSGGNITRLHQEDICQALGVPSSMKYQNEGGPTLSQVFEVVRRTSATKVRDLLLLTDAIIFNFFIGNYDAHGKNFSLVQVPQKSRQVAYHLAPLYDLVSTGILDGYSKKMAMKIGNQYDSEKVFRHNWEDFAKATGQNPQLVCKRVLAVARLIERALENVKITTPVQNDIRTFTIQRIATTRRRFELADQGESPNT